MIITNKLKMDLQSPGSTPIIHAAQNDRNTRSLELTLLSGQKPLQIPQAVTVLISYASVLGGNGTYDTMQDGSPAWTIQGNILTITLDPRMFLLPGSVSLSVRLLCGQSVLGNLPIQLYVYASPFPTQEPDPDHFHVTAYLPAPERAAAGQLFQAEAVDERGTVTAVRAVDPEDLQIRGDASAVPAGVTEEAARVVDTVLTREDPHPFRFIAFADAHQKNGHEAITAGTRELGQALGEVLRQIGVDFVASLGDSAWADSAESAETALEETKTFNALICDSLRAETQIWLEGNHETSKLTPAQIQALVYSRNRQLVRDADHWTEGYGYLDFPSQKVRVVCLNTNQGSETMVCGVSDAQLKWFAETALNMERKTDWSLMTLGHHPLSYNDVTMVKNCASVMEAFLSGNDFSFTTSGGTSLNIDYSSKHCTYIGHFHGHAHAFSLVKMQKYVSTGIYRELNAWEICIPNACSERSNQYLNNGTYTARYSTPTTYAKENTDGKRTAFNIITVCLDEKKIYADHYGAGIDREVSYDFAVHQTYTNQIPLSTDTDGSIYGGDYNGDGISDGYQIDTYLSGGNPVTRTGVETTGFIPFDQSETYEIYLSGITAASAESNFRIMLYDTGKRYHNQLASANWTSNSFAPVILTADSGNNISKIDMTDFVHALKATNGTVTAFFRLCAPHIDGNSVITVNEPIE